MNLEKIDWESIDKRMDRLEYENSCLMKELNDVLKTVCRIGMLAKAIDDDKLRNQIMKKADEVVSRVEGIVE